MPLLGSVLKNTTKYAYKLNKNVQCQDSSTQSKQLKKLLSKAKDTEFGTRYNFAGILQSSDIMDTYRRNVPIFDYNRMFNKFWHKTLNNVENVTWPGRIEKFALTSGTTGSASKRIPVSSQMIHNIKKTSIKQLLTLSNLDLKADFYNKEILFLGGSTNLSRINDQFEGDLSGILSSELPYWLNPFSKPEKKIRAISDWGDKIDKIVENAPNWDIGIVAGVPSWVQIMIEKIVDHYELDSIFEIWPNLKIYVHGGVKFDPYIQAFNDLFNHQLIYLDTYLCSEGFLAFQPTSSDSLHLLLNHGIYFEFIPFDEEHFSPDGELKKFDSTLTIDEVEENVQYALLISTNAGTWRYLIGDTIMFTNLESYKIKITGRTKHFLSLCGEHLSVDNMTEAITNVSYQLDLDIREFAVLGENNKTGFGHHWYVGCDQPINEEALTTLLDQQLKYLNADYKIERSFALTEISVDVIPTKMFYDFMKMRDKYGAQYKFPRVLKGKLARDWVEYIQLVNQSVNPRILIY
ncbi:MAG: GH3 auxin-responsive promoter family protein [Flavobacteriales bacterium]|nr:GH3 auxin-responsive promoter family protein [Flavobacteriales bacterium]